MKYCVYITTYSGSKLPPKYIGSTSTARINSGYRGTVSSKKWKMIWLQEMDEHPELFNTEIVELCDTRADAIHRELELQHELDVVRSPEWINEGYAQPNGFAGRDVSGCNNPMYKRGDLNKKWAVENPDLISARNRKAALTQWSTPETREARINAMRGKTKTIKDAESFRELQRKKSLISKEKRAIRIEYMGAVYVGWRELYDATGVSKHLYKKYYLKGINPCDRIGKNGPVPSEERR